MPDPPEHTNTPILRCIAPDPSTNRVDAFDDTVVQNMLTLRFIQQKLGLDSLILRCTQDSVAQIHNCAYANLAYTHSSDTYTNTQHRVNILSHLHTQEQEQAVACPLFCDSHKHQPHDRYTRHLQPPTSKAEFPQGWLMRQVCMTMGGTSVWVSDHCYATACNLHLNVRDPPPFLGSSDHASSV